MIRYFTAATLGFAVIFGAIGPAAAGYRHGHFWIDQYPSDTYSYNAQPPKYAGHTRKAQPNIRLDFETEAVWRNLRPEWFD